MTVLTFWSTHRGSYREHRGQLIDRWEVPQQKTMHLSATYFLWFIFKMNVPTMQRMHEHKGSKHSCDEVILTEHMGLLHAIICNISLIMCSSVFSPAGPIDFIFCWRFKKHIFSPELWTTLNNINNNKTLRILDWTWTFLRSGITLFYQYVLLMNLMQQLYLYFISKCKVLVYCINPGSMQAMWHIKNLCLKHWFHAQEVNLLT